MSSMIYSKDLIDKANFVRYYDTNFIQFGIIFEYLENKNSPLCYWYEKNCLISIPKQSTWFNNVIKVFGKSWTECILSLPSSIPLSIKLKYIEGHGKKAELFTFNMLMKFRVREYITKQYYMIYKVYFPFFR